MHLFIPRGKSHQFTYQHVFGNSDKSLQSHMETLNKQKMQNSTQRVTINVLYGDIYKFSSRTTVYWHLHNFQYFSSPVLFLLNKAEPMGWNDSKVNCTEKKISCSQRWFPYTIKNGNISKHSKSASFRVNEKWCQLCF